MLLTALYICLTPSLYRSTSERYRCLLAGECFPRCCSDSEQLSISTCPMVVSDELTVFDLWNSNTNSGFFRMLICGEGQADRTA